MLIQTYQFLQSGETEYSHFSCTVIKELPDVFLVYVTALFVSMLTCDSSTKRTGLELRN